VGQAVWYRPASYDGEEQSHASRTIKIDNLHDADSHLAQLLKHQNIDQLMKYGATRKSTLEIKISEFTSSTKERGCLMS
jgi:hypothetical protein